MVVAGVVVTVAFVFVLRLVWRHFFIAPIKHVKGGYKHDIILPHTETIELYSADISSASMKVRFCLAVVGIKYKSHIMKLPSVGSFETKSTEYLRINPAGTVPVLVHNGHPIHESSEQIQYIANKLLPANGPELIPTDSSKKLDTEYWIGQTSMYTHEILGDLEAALRRRPGNCLPIITMPCFAAAAETFTWRTVFLGILRGGLTKRTILSIMFGTIGVYTFKFVPMLSRVVQLGKKALLLHLKELEELLKVKQTAFICGDDITLADVGWAPILERMDFAGWWEHIDSIKYHYVTEYWNNMKSLPSYQEAIKPVTLTEDFIANMKGRITQWKTQHVWFKNLYE